MCKNDRQKIIVSNLKVIVGYKTCQTTRRFCICVRDKPRTQTLLQGIILAREKQQKKWPARYFHARHEGNSDEV